MHETHQATSAVNSTAVSPTQSHSIVESVSSLVKDFRGGQFDQGAATLMSEIVVPAGTGLLCLLASYFLAKFVSKRVASAVCRRVDETLGKFLGKICYYAILISALAIVMSKVGIPVSGFMAVLATAGFAIGLAFQGTLSNFSAGILLLVFRPFKVGDSVIVSNNVMGEVNEIDIFTTTLDTPDNRRLIIPNSSIASCTIENMSFHRHRRVDLTVGVEYSASVERTRQALIECVESLGPSMVAGEDRGYQVILKHLGPSSVDWMLRVWVMRQDYHAVKERLIQKVKQTLHQYQIGIPFPQMHLHMSPAAAAAIEATQSAEKVTASRSLADPVSPITMPQLHPPQSPSRIRPRARSGEQSSQPGLPPNS